MRTPRAVPPLRTAFPMGVAAALAWLLLGCSPSSDPGERSLRIGYSRLRISLPVFVAQERGLFKKQGIQARLEMYDTGQALGQALVEGKLDAGGYLAPGISVAGIQRTGRPMYFVTTLLEDHDHRITYLLRRRAASGRKPEIASVADLRGKKVGILPTLYVRSTLEAFLRKNGVNPSEVTIQNVEPLLQPQLLAAGGVDALYTLDPPATAAIAAGTAELIGPDVEALQVYGDPYAMGNFLLSKEWADANPQAAQGIARALDEAISYIHQNPKDAKQALKPYLPAVFHPHIDLYPDPLYETTAAAREDLLQDLIRKYREFGVLNQDFPVHGLVYRADSRSALSGSAGGRP